MAANLLMNCCTALLHFEWPDFRLVEKTIREKSPQMLAQYVGKYEMAPGAYAKISMNHRKLYGQVRGREPTELFPESETKLFTIKGPTVEDNSGII